MNYENFLVVLSVVLGLLGTQLRRLRKWLRKGNANLVIGNDTSKIEVTISSSNPDQRKDDSTLEKCPEPSSDPKRSKW